MHYKSMHLILYEKLFRQTIFPLLVMTTSPFLTLLLPYIIVERNANLITTFTDNSIKEIIITALNGVNLFDLECWLIIMATLTWGYISLYLPGQIFYGPAAANGFRPKYIDNGFIYYLITVIFTLFIITQFSVSHLYYKFVDLSAILIIFGLIVSLFSYIKGLLRPSHGYYDKTNNPIFDFYWGIELYPNLGHYVNFKYIIMTRFSLILWQILILVLWKAEYELNQKNLGEFQINWPLTALTMVNTFYIARIYYFLKGFVHILDMSLDRFGFYIGWGCIAFLPVFYSSNSLYLVQNSPKDSFGFISFLIVFGTASFFNVLTYLADNQKLIFIETNGKCEIWGQKAQYIKAKYMDLYGNEKEKLLLISGFWGICRHLNYTFEFIIGFSIGSVGLLSHPIPYLYSIYCGCLIIHRTVRDHDKCSHKYAVYWDEYCKSVPYRMIPRLF